VTHLDGSLAAVAGTMGGDSQPQILLQVLARLLVNGQSTAEVISAPRWVLVPTGTGTGFDTWERGGRVRIAVEEHAPATWAPGLAARGHRVVRGGSFGHTQLITVAASDLEGAADPRAGTGAAVGF
jgi:gamma-glutamyltranspeptidase/glutathione hydrolase